MMERRRRWFAAGAGLAGFAVALAVVSAWAQAGPTLVITSPRHGETIRGDTVPMRWKVSGVEVARPAHAHHREEGHFHLFLDRADFRPGVEIPRDMEAEGIFHTAETSYEIKGLKPGRHYVFVVLSYHHHIPWAPLVYDVVSFEVAP